MHKWLFLSIFIFPFVSNAQMSSIQLELKPIPQPITRNADVENWNKSQKDFSRLSPDAKEFLYWVNLCRKYPSTFWDSVATPVIKEFPSLNTKEAKSLKADLDKTGSLPMFRLNDTLINFAQLLASDISAKKAPPSHTSTDGTTFNTRMTRAGIKKCAGENVSVAGPNGALMAVLLLYLDIGLPDLGHRKSLLDPNLVETGIGLAPYSKNQFFYVQDLACSQQ